MADKLGERDAIVLGRIFEWVDANELRETFRDESAHGHSYVPYLRSEFWEAVPFGVTTNQGHVFLGGASLRRTPPFRIKDNLDALTERLYAIPEVTRTPKDIYPHIRLSELAEPGTWDRFFEIIDWVVERLKSAKEKGLK